MNSDPRSLPHNSVIIRFGTNTPYYLMAMGYGIFADPSTRTNYISIDHWIGEHMFVRKEDRARIMNAPNGYIAHRNILDIIDKARPTEDNPVINPRWELDRDKIMFEGLRLKYTRNLDLYDMLMRTGERPIYDASRVEELYWCYSEGAGKNKHAELLMDLRSKLQSGKDVPPAEL